MEELLSLLKSTKVSQVATMRPVYVTEADSLPKVWGMLEKSDPSLPLPLLTLR